WLVQRVTEATGRVAARALETGTFDRPAELLHPGDRRVIAHRRSLSDRVRLHRDDATMPPERGLYHRLLARTKLPAHVQHNRFERSLSRAGAGAASRHLQLPQIGPHRCLAAAWSVSPLWWRLPR